MKCFIISLLFVFFLSGCTMRFKAEKLEMDTEEPHGNNVTYKLESMTAFDDAH